MKLHAAGFNPRYGPEICFMPVIQTISDAAGFNPLRGADFCQPHLLR
jgi:hypothetical protein